MVACFLSFSLDVHRPHVATGFLGSDSCGEREEKIGEWRVWPLHRKSSVAGTRGDFESAVCLSVCLSVTLIACSGWDLVAALGPQDPPGPRPGPLLLVGRGTLDRRSPLDGIMLSEIAGKPRVIGRMQGPWSHFRVSQLAARGGP